MQVCTSLQTDNHTSTPPLSFLQAGCSSCRPTNSVKALKAHTYYIIFGRPPIGGKLPPSPWRRHWSWCGLHKVYAADDDWWCGGQDEQRRLVRHNSDIIDTAARLGFDVVDTFHMTMSRFKDFLQGQCACHFHRVRVSLYLLPLFFLISCF